MEVFFQSTEVVRCNGLEFVRCHRKDLDQDLSRFLYCVEQTKGQNLLRSRTFRDVPK